MKKTLFGLLLVTSLMALGASLFAQDQQQQRRFSFDTHPSIDALRGWRLGVQCWSFNKFTFMESIDKVGELGLSWMEAYPGQPIGGDSKEKFEPGLSPEGRALVKQRLKEAGIRVINFGVTGLSKDEAESRKVFEFAKDMGIETILSEPAFDAYDTVDKLAQEFQIKVAVHNHPKPSQYWNPDILLEQLKNRSEFIGAACDTGHWVRSGLDPVECLKKLEGHIVSVHFKEIIDGHDTTWGQGNAKAPLLLDELNRQQFNGVFAIEYEYNWDNNVPDIRKCVDYFNSYVAKYRTPSWKPVFAKDLSDAIVKKEGSWTYEDGVLTRKGGSDIWTKEQYDNFILDCSFKTVEGTNSGIFIRTGDTENWLPWIEVQVQSDFGKPLNRNSCGGIFDIYQPKVSAVKPAGQWNRMTIIALNNKVTIILNGQVTVDMDLDLWTQAGKNPDGSANKFKDIAYKDLPRKGNLCFQDHGSDVTYRNIMIRSIRPRQQQGAN